jgi:hypothetical protein
MLITEQNLDIWYKAYRKQFDATSKRLKSRGLKIRQVTGRDGKQQDVQPLTRAQFAGDFRSELADITSAGKYKSGERIAQSMAKTEVYAQSYEQAKKAAQQAVDTQGKTMSTKLIEYYRSGSWWDVIQQKRAELSELGYNTYEQNLQISEEFYGSEHKTSKRRNQ